MDVDKSYNFKSVTSEKKKKTSNYFLFVHYQGASQTEPYKIINVPNDSSHFNIFFFFIDFWFLKWHLRKT